MAYFFKPIFCIRDIHDRAFSDIRRQELRSICCSFGHFLNMIEISSLLTYVYDKSKRNRFLSSKFSNCRNSFSAIPKQRRNSSLRRLLIEQIIDQCFLVMLQPGRLNDFSCWKCPRNSHSYEATNSTIYTKLLTNISNTRKLAHLSLMHSSLGDDHSHFAKKDLPLRMKQSFIKWDRSSTCP